MGRPGRRRAHVRRVPGRGPRAPAGCGLGWCSVYGEHTEGRDGMLDAYEEYVSAKRKAVPDSGFDPEDVNDKLFGFQKEIVRWACRKGKSAVFADCGMGKTAMQIEWARQVCEHVGGDSKVLARPFGCCSANAQGGCEIRGRRHDVQMRRRRQARRERD